MLVLASVRRDKDAAARRGAARWMTSVRSSVRPRSPRGPTATRGGRCRGHGARGWFGDLGVTMRYEVVITDGCDG